MNPVSILLLSKTTQWCKHAQAFLLKHASDVTIAEGERGAPFPGAARQWEGDYIISFLSPWIVPASTLGRARRGALNLHPAPPEYPGIGCYNFALYDNAVNYGVTCHHMAPRVDTGPIIKVARCPVFATDTVASLKDRSMAHLLILFYEVASMVMRGETLPSSSESWTRRPYTRAELDALCRITPEMSRDEVLRRVRATAFPGQPGPYVDLAGLTFTLRDSH